MVRKALRHVCTAFLCLGIVAPREAQPGEGAPAWVTLVENGAPRAVVILPDKAIPAQTFAAEELIYHVRKATGAELPSHRESDAPTDAACLVYIGPCRATAAADIDVETLPPSGHVVRSAGNALFLAGRDRDRGRMGSYWTADWQGTLYAVYDFLETDMRVRWLWRANSASTFPSARTSR